MGNGLALPQNAGCGPAMRPRDVETLVQAEARPRALVATESRQAKGRNCPKASPACAERQNVVQENTTATDMAHGVDEPQEHCAQ